jgi:hypothetical protein
MDQIALKIQGIQTEFEKEKIFESTDESNAAQVYIESLTEDNESNDAIIDIEPSNDDNEESSLLPNNEINSRQNFQQELDSRNKKEAERYNNLLRLNKLLKKALSDLALI